MCFYSSVLGDILDILNKIIKMLQSVSTDLITVVQLYNSLIHYVKSARNRNIMFKGTSRV